MKMKQAMKQVTWGIATQAKKNENKEIGESCVQTPHLQSKSILSHQHQQQCQAQTIGDQQQCQAQTIQLRLVVPCMKKKSCGSSTGEPNKANMIQQVVKFSVRQTELTSFWAVRNIGRPRKRCNIGPNPYRRPTGIRWISNLQYK